MKQALLLSHGDLSVFFTRPISAFFLAVTAVVVVTTVRKRQKVSPGAS